MCITNFIDIRFSIKIITDIKLIIQEKIKFKLFYIFKQEK